MSDIEWIVILICSMVVVFTVLYNRRKTRSTIERVENMLDSAMNGTFSDKTANS